MSTKAYQTGLTSDTQNNIRSTGLNVTQHFILYYTTSSLLMEYGSGTSDQGVFYNLLTGLIPQLWYNTPWLRLLITP